MFKIRVSKDGQSAEATLRVENGNTSYPVIFEGPLSLLVERYLNDAYGPFGHTINLSRANPIDLHYALSQSPFDFEVLEGAELVEVYDPEIPEGAVT